MNFKDALFIGIGIKIGEFILLSIGENCKSFIKNFYDKPIKTNNMKPIQNQEDKGFCPKVVKDQIGFKY